MSAAKHSPLPWVAPGNGCIVGADDALITSVPRGKGAGASARRDADIALIVRAVNSHEQLIAALQCWMKYFGGDHETAVLAIAEDGSTLTEAQKLTRAAIAKATQ